MSSSTRSIYNSTDGPLIIDRAGRILGAREHRDGVDVEASPVAGHIKAGRIIVQAETEPATAAETETTDAEPQETPRASSKARRTSTTTEEA